MAKIRGTHSTPGAYTQFTDLSYAAKTMGITTLGLVGETLKGPAFEPIMISDATEFQSYFGGTSAEKFKDSQYPKYQLPYIANSYLKASDQLYVCRVLGLSGYNAGPAFVIMANGDNNKKFPVLTLRSRGHYVKYGKTGTGCTASDTYDTVSFDCDEVKLESYSNIETTVNGCGESSTSGATNLRTISVNFLNFGQFTIVCYKDDEEVGRYPVSLNAGTKDYIYDVIGDDPSNGNAKVFVEEFYDNYLSEMIAYSGVTSINTVVTNMKSPDLDVVCDPVSDFVELTADKLTRNNVGKTYLYKEEYADEDATYVYNLREGEMQNGSGEPEIITSETSPMREGYIYTVVSFFNSSTNITEYVYASLIDDNGNKISLVTDAETGGETSGKIQTYSIGSQKTKVVRVLSDGLLYYSKESGGTQTVQPLMSISDYHDQFRCASTPWFVSEIKGSGIDFDVKRLFRLHTITDGNISNTEIKVSIANIRPDDGRFDLYIRDFNDSDANPTILESYKNLTMAPGDSKYIGLQIGTLDGSYETKSKYVMAEIIENEMTKNCVPCGFLGYPVHQFDGTSEKPNIVYNRFYDKNIKVKRQYFGISDISGIDTDMLSYKGHDYYTEQYETYTNPFHLDSTLSASVAKLKIGLDGDNTVNLKWNTVDPNNTSDNGTKSPVIGSESSMAGTIYEDKGLRKFTACFYGGFDGWDIYRNSRTNTDEYTANNYKGRIVNGEGQTFSKIQDGTYLSLEGNCITSDYYAYLAGIKQFEQPEKYAINLFATPGIDYVNNLSLVNEVIDMLEDVRKDTLYVVDTPDKPWGASDAVDEMYSSADAAGNLEDAGIDTYYACTYYPWVKYFDKANNSYIYLPPTKDVLRNMADVDNKKFPWYAPAGIERGTVDCTKLHFFPKLENTDTLYSGRINPLISFSKDGIKIFGQKVMYSQETPMNRVNVVRLMLYMRKLIIESTRSLLFEQNDQTLKNQFENIVKPILSQIKNDRGISDFKLNVSQTAEQMDEHEMSCDLWVKPIGALEYLEINFIVTPQSVDFQD
mgnify:CR=1 FL=1